MSYSWPIGSLNPSWSGAPSYQDPRSNLPGIWGDRLYLGAEGFKVQGSGSPLLSWQGMILASSWDSVGFGRYLSALRPDQYRAPQFAFNVSWVGTDTYSNPIGVFTATWAPIRYVAPIGVKDSDFSSPTLKWSQFVTPSGSDNLWVGENVYALMPWQYPPPQWRMDASWVGKAGYSAPAGLANASWQLPSESTQIAHTGTDYLESGAPTVYNLVQITNPLGIAAQGFGTAELNKSAIALLPAGFSGLGIGATVIYNLRQYLSPISINALDTSTAYVSGGVKNISVAGLGSLAFGNITAVNTKASQTAAPTGIAIPTFTAPGVSPRMLYLSGVAFPGMGAVTVQRNPMPFGFDAALFGQAYIEYKTKTFAPIGIAASDLGYPEVFDPTQKVYPSAPVEVGLFGDARIVNKSAVVQVEGIDALGISAWALVESTRRHLEGAGWNSLAFSVGSITNKSPSLIPSGFDALSSPSATDTGIGFSIRTLYPSGINLSGQGSPELVKTPELLPNGFSGDMGTPTVWPSVRNLDGWGVDTQGIGRATLWFRYRDLALQGYATEGYGKTTASHRNRELLGLGADTMAFGVATFGNLNRSLLPSGIGATFASAHMVGGLRFLRTVGFESTEWGGRIIPEVQSTYPLSFTGSYGMLVLYNRTQLVKPPGFLTVGQQSADRWGTPEIWNLRQYLSMLYDPDSELNPPTWPQWTLIENRNHTMHTSGLNLALIGQPQIDNKARQLLSPGIAAPANDSSFLAAFVAYRVRSFHINGIEPPYISGWETTYNSAAVLALQGISGQVFGSGRIENTRRFFDRIGGIEAGWSGYPMVDFRIRALSIEGRYSIDAPSIPLPETKLYTRYVEPRGTDMSGVGGASLAIHWTLITPRWTLQNLYGSPALRNVTPELYQQGCASEEFGDAFVRLQWRPVEAEGSLIQLFGQFVIAYRNRALYLSGLNAGAFGDKLTVVRTGAPPYSTQYVDLNPVIIAGEVGGVAGEPSGDGYGIKPPQPNQVGLPIINQQIVYVKQESSSDLFGGGRVTANSIRVEPGYWDLLVGAPTISARIRRLIVEKYDYEDSQYQGKPVMSPLTVWAVMEAPPQAIVNHNGARLHYVDGLNRPPGAIFGTPTAMNQHRSIQVSGNNGDEIPWTFANYGLPIFSLRRQYVSPAGFGNFRSGWHSVPGPQSVEQFSSADCLMLGDLSIAPGPYYGPQFVKEEGLDSLAIGNPQVDLWIRSIFPVGDIVMSMGSSLLLDTPYQWQGLRIGPLMPTLPSGYDAASMGEPALSFRIREVDPNGFDAFLCEYQLDQFEQRMRVSRNTVVRPSHRLSPVGIPAFASFASDVRPGVRYIRPDGNADQFRKGAF